MINLLGFAHGLHWGTSSTRPHVLESRLILELCYAIYCEKSVDKSVSKMEYCSRVAYVAAGLMNFTPAFVISDRAPCTI